MSNWYEREQELRAMREIETAKAEQVCQEVYKQAADAAKRGERLPATEWERVKQAREAAVTKDHAYIEHLQTAAVD